MGCCCSSAPVENATNDPNSQNHENQPQNLTNQNPNNNSTPNSGNLLNSDSSNSIKGDQKTHKKDKDSLLTISENNQINDYDYDPSYDEEYNLEGYEFEKKIGYGGSAEVVQMSKNGVSYAVKIIDLNNAKTNYLESDHKPKEEVAILKQFNHVHVVKFIEFIEDQDRNKLYIVMELLSGGTIMECKTFEEKREAFTEALSAVQYIHFQRIAHQDIKPANILRNENGTIKLVDFGSAVFVEEGKSTIPSGLTGTTMFSPPERFNSVLYDPFAGDVWSLGVTLYTMLFNHLPFDGPGIFQVQNLIQNSEPQYPTDEEFNDAVDLIKQMLKKNPIDRIKVDQICDHPFIIQTSTTSSLRSLFDSSSRIFESLKSTDTMNSMTRISRGSLRSSLKGKNSVKIKASKTSVKKLPQKPKRQNQKPQSQLITGPKAKLILEKQKQAQKQTQKQAQKHPLNQKETNNKEQKQETNQKQKTEDNEKDNTNITKQQEPTVEKKDQYYVVNIDSEPSFQDYSDDNNKIIKKPQNQPQQKPQTPATPSKPKRTNTSNTNRDQSNKSKKEENNQEKIPEVQKPKDTKKNDKKPESSRKQSRDNNINTDTRPSTSRKSKPDITIECQKLDSSIRRGEENKSKNQKDTNNQEQKPDSPRKPKDGPTNPVRTSSNKPLKPRRQSRQFTPKKE